MKMEMKLLSIILGYCNIGVEFEGGLPEEDGILATKDLLVSASKTLN